MADSDISLISREVCYGYQLPDGAFRCGDDHLIESVDNITGRIQSRDRGLLVCIDLQRAVLITARPQRARQIVLRAAAESA